MSADVGPDPDPIADRPAAIELYWRPGCGFCTMLRRRLDQLGIERTERDIWADPDAAAIVRVHADGNETVPTVVLGDVGLVNPSAREVVRLLAAEAPHLLPDDLDPDAAGRGPVARFADRLLHR